jgi:hypothetical protein
MTAGSWIPDRAKRRQAHRKRDTCHHYSTYSAGCTIHRILACARCKHHTPKTGKSEIRRGAEITKQMRDTCKRYDPESKKCLLYKIVHCRKCVGYVKRGVLETNGF